MLTVVFAALLALSPASASAWKFVFQDFLDTHSQGGNQGLAAGHTVAKKCHGGMLGDYDLVSRVHAEGGDTEITHIVHATLPVTGKWRHLDDVEVVIHASDNFDPDVIAELTAAYGEFWEGVFARFEAPDELGIRHPDLVVFGHTLLESDHFILEFKPKKGC